MPKAEHDPETRTKKGRSVLVADDSPLVRRIVCTALASDGFDVCGEANDGHEAIKLAEKFCPDLIILDLSMPVINGIQAAPVLRKVVPECRIILFTIHANNVLEQQVQKIEVDAVLSKAEPLSDLLKKAHNLVDEKRA